MKKKTVLLMSAIMMALSAITANGTNVPNGIYIVSTDGEYYITSNWVSSKTAMGIAIVTDNTHAMMSLDYLTYNDANTIWGPSGNVAGPLVTEPNYSNCKPGVVINDYAGRYNTNMLSNSLVFDEETAVYLATHYKFANGFSGYLPGLGELIDVFQNLTEVNNALETAGGTQIVEDWHWTSSQHYLEYRIWAYGGKDSEGNRWFAQLRNSDNNMAQLYGAVYLYTRAFTELPGTLKCANPEISYANGKIEFSCETKDVQYVSEVTVSDAKKYYDSSITLSQTYKVSVYATKQGYVNSDVITREIVITGNGQAIVVGDVDGNGKVNVADHVKLSNIIIGK